MRALLAIAIPYFLLAPAAAEDSKPAEQMLTLTSRSELVLVPTLVRDKSGSHITGLSQTDFALLENGSERKIAVFEEIKTSTVRSRRQTLPAGEFSNYLVNEPAPRRVTIIVMDSINTQFADWAYARDQLLKFLEETAGSNEPMALLQLRRGGVRVIHDFTTDPAVLAKAVWRLKSGHKPPPDLAEDVPDAIVAAESQQLASMMQDIQ